MTGLDMWWKADIANVLIGIDMGTAYMGSDLPPGEARAFRAGFSAALGAVATSLGIETQRRAPRVRLIEMPDSHRLAGR